MRDIKKTIESIVSRQKIVTPSNIKQVEDEVNAQLMALFNNPNFTIQVEISCQLKGFVTIEKLLVFDSDGNIVDPKELKERLK